MCSVVQSSVGVWVVVCNEVWCMGGSVAIGAGEVGF